jgi:hypothetical protein
MTTTKKISVSLPADLSDDLTRASKRLGVSRSALLATMLQTALPPILLVTNDMPAPDDVAAMQRYTSAKAIELRKMLGSTIDEIEAFPGKTG